MKKYVIRLLLFSSLLYSAGLLNGQDLVRKPNSELINSLNEIIGTTGYERGTTKWFVFSNKKGCTVYGDANEVLSNSVGGSDPTDKERRAGLDWVLMRRHTMATRTRRCFGL